MRFVPLLLMVSLCGCGDLVQTIRQSNAIEAVQPSYEERAVVEGPPRIELRSNGCWRGSVNGASVEGCGVQFFDLSDPCWTFQSNGERQFIQVRMKQGRGEERISTASYGVITGCAASQP